MKKINKFWLFFNLSVTLLVFVLSYLYQVNGFSYKFKRLNSGVCFALGAVNLLYALITNQGCKSFCLSMALGLAFAGLGDCLIDSSFMLGAGLFGVGHILFVLAYCFLQKLKRLDLFISLALFALAATFLIVTPFKHNDILIIRGVLVGYALVISTMLGKSIANLIRDKSVATIVIVCASSLFFFSDLMLVFAGFITDWALADNLCLATYYPAVALLALSTCLNTITGKNNQTQQ